MQNIHIVIMVEPGPLRHGLYSLLSTLAVDVQIHEVADLAAVLALTEAIHPALALVDLALREGSGWTALRRMAEISPGTRRIALANEVDQIEEAASVAEVVAIKGCPPSDLVSMIGTLLAEILD